MQSLAVDVDPAKGVSRSLIVRAFSELALKGQIWLGLFCFSEVTLGKAETYQCRVYGSGKQLESLVGLSRITDRRGSKGKSSTVERGRDFFTSFASQRCMSAMAFWRVDDWNQIFEVGPVMIVWIC